MCRQNNNFKINSNHFQSLPRGFPSIKHKLCQQCTGLILSRRASSESTNYKTLENILKNKPCVARNLLPWNNVRFQYWVYPQPSPQSLGSLTKITEEKHIFRIQEFDQHALLHFYSHITLEGAKELKAEYRSSLLILLNDAPDGQLLWVYLNACCLQKVRSCLSSPTCPFPSFECWWSTECIRLDNGTG